MRYFIILLGVCIFCFFINDAVLGDTKVAEINYTEFGKLAEQQHINLLLDPFFLLGIQFRWVHEEYYPSYDEHTIEWPYVGESDVGKSFEIMDSSKPDFPHFVEELTSPSSSWWDYFYIRWSPAVVFIADGGGYEPEWVKNGESSLTLPDLSGCEVNRINLVVNELTVAPNWEPSGDWFEPFLLQLWYHFNVTFEIYGVCEAAKLVVSSPLFVFAAPEGGMNPVEQVLSIRNIGGGDMNWVISEDCDWLTVEPKSGTCRDEVDDVNLYVDISGLAVGKYNCQITVTADGAEYSPQIIDVVLTICGELQLLGSGEPNDPYQIGTPDELIALGQYPCYYDKCFVLVYDIDLSGHAFDKALIAADKLRLPWCSEDDHLSCHEKTHSTHPPGRLRLRSEPGS